MRFTRQSNFSVAERRAAGFTLLELVVVIAILAILATLAVRSLGGLEDQTRFDETQRTLAGIQASIDGDRSIRQPDGTMIPNGFVNDMGRLPNLPPGATPFTPLTPLQELTALQELWVQPAGVPAYAIQPADTSVNSDIKIGTGWHGPYLQLPFGQTNLVDGWGNSFTVTPANPPIALGIQSLGSDNMPGATNGDPYAIDLPASPILFLSSDYFTTVTCLVTGTSPLGSPASAKLFQPDPVNAGQVMFVAGVETTAGGNVTFTFSGVSPGARVIRLYTDAASTLPLATEYINVPKGGLPNAAISLSATSQPSTQPSN
jgi:prepilin-type N-terminal cleavage/methylation domain-containing protein